MQALCSDEASFIQAKVKTFVTRSKKAVTVHCASPLFSWSFLFCPWFFFYFSHLSNALSPTLELWWLSEPFFKQNKSRYFKSSSNKAVVDHCSSFLFSWSFLLCPWFFLHFFSLHLSNTFELSRWQELRAYTIDQTKKTNKQTTAITFVARSLKSIVVQCASFFVLGSSCIWARLCMKTARTFSLNRRSNTIKFKLKPLVLLLLLASKQHFVANFGAVKTARTTSHYQWVLPVPDPELSLPVKRRWPLWLLLLCAGCYLEAEKKHRTFHTKKGQELSPYSRVNRFVQFQTVITSSAACLQMEDCKNGILLPKLFWPTVRNKYSSDHEKLLKFEDRDEWIPLFSDIRILGYLGYWFFLDTWISGYLDIMDTWIHRYLDTWISVFFGYMDAWIPWI